MDDFFIKFNLNPTKKYDPKIMEDCQEVLGLPEGFTNDEFKRAKRERWYPYHTDLHLANTSKREENKTLFQWINSFVEPAALLMTRVNLTRSREVEHQAQKDKEEAALQAEANSSNATSSEQKSSRSTSDDHAEAEERTEALPKKVKIRHDEKNDEEPVPVPESSEELKQLPKLCHCRCSDKEKCTNGSCSSANHIHLRFRISKKRGALVCCPFADCPHESFSKWTDNTKDSRQRCAQHASLAIEHAQHHLLCSSMDMLKDPLCR